MKYSVLIPQIVATQHARRRSRERSSYLALIGSLTSASARALMLAMLAEEIEIRAQMIRELTLAQQSDIEVSVRPKPGTLVDRQQPVEPGMLLDEERV